MSTMDALFRDRQDAGNQLAQRLAQENLPSPLILGLPRGGVPVAFEVAKALDAPMQVFISCKIGCPGQPEYGVGAITETGSYILDFGALEEIGIERRAIEKVVENQRRRLATYVKLFRNDQALPSIKGHSVVLVDDGLATGITMAAAVESIRERDPQQIVVAAPVASVQAQQAIEKCADKVITLATPVPFHAVGLFYEDFSQLTDRDVILCLKNAGLLQDP